MDPDGTVRLVGAFLRGTTSLHGAACQGRHGLFDEIPGQSREARERQQQRHTAAADLCQRCPVRARCPNR